METFVCCVQSVLLNLSKADKCDIYFIFPLNPLPPMAEEKTASAEITIVYKYIERNDVDSRAYFEGRPVMTKDAMGDFYHLGMISSSTTWAEKDMRGRFIEDFDRIFPKGWEIVAFVHKSETNIQAKNGG